MGLSVQPAIAIAVQKLHSHLLLSIQGGLNSCLEHSQEGTRPMSPSCSCSATNPPRRMKLPREYEESENGRFRSCFHYSPDVVRLLELAKVFLNTRLTLGAISFFPSAVLTVC